MCKKLICLSLMLLILLTGAAAMEHRSISVYVDNNKITFDTEPYLKGGYTMVPMRAIMEALDATVSWEEESRTATAIQNMNITKFTIGSNDYYKNGYLQYMPMAAEQVNNRTYVPLRAISEGFGYLVSWDEHTSTVYISSQKKSVPEENIYYIRLSDGTYLSASESGVGAVSDKSPDAMWALECVDGKANIFRIYSLSLLDAPLGYCSHRVNTGAEPEDEKPGKKTGADITDKETTEENRLCLCKEENHCWEIEALENGGYIIYPRVTAGAEEEKEDTEEGDEPDKESDSPIRDEKNAEADGDEADELKAGEEESTGTHSPEAEISHEEITDKSYSEAIELIPCV